MVSKASLDCAARVEVRVMPLLSVACAITPHACQSPLSAPGALKGDAVEYLVEMTTTVPEGTPAEAVDDIRSREAARAQELAGQGHLLRLWRPPLRPGEWRTLGLFAASDPEELEAVLASMPLRVWRSDDVTPLAVHPNDPARVSVGRSSDEPAT